MSFLGNYTFKITSENPAIAINKLRENSIRYSQLCSQNNIINGSIPFYQKKKLIRVCKEIGAEINIVSANGIIKIIDKNIRRKGIVFGIIFSFIFILYLSNIVLKIDITGCDEKTRTQIMNFINRCGINYGKVIPLIDFNDLETQIFNSFENISFVDISSYNSTLHINTALSTAHEGVIPDNRRPSNIVSTKDAQIVKVNVSAGQLMSLVGSGVRKGDLLVSGIVDNQKGRYMYYNSIAQIWGKYEETVVFEQSLCEIVEIVEENCLTKNSLSFFEFEIPLSKQDVGNNYFIESTYKKNIQFLGINLPISIVTREYSSNSFVQENFTQDEAISEIEKRITLYEENLLETVEIENKIIDKSIQEDVVRYEIRYTLIGEIGVEKEIMLKS